MEYLLFSRKQAEKGEAGFRMSTALFLWSMASLGCVPRNSAEQLDFNWLHVK